MRHLYLRIMLLLLVALLIALPDLPSLPVLAAGGDEQILRHQVARLVAGDVQDGDLFGLDVAIDGDLAVVGECNDSELAHEAGAAYIFQRDPGGSGDWVQLVKLTASDPFPYADFGRAVAVDGDTVVVSADVISPGGAVYIFQRDQGGPGAWGQLARITGLDTSWSDRFGYDLALDGDTLIVGAYAGGDYDGKAYIFYRDQGGPNAWGQVAMIVGSQVTPYDYFGCTVDVSGDTAIVGAPGDNGIIGMAYIFQRDQGGADAWGQVAALTPPDPVQHGWFGLPVSIDGDTAAISATGQGSDGIVFIYYRDQGGPDGWGLAARLTAPNPKVQVGLAPPWRCATIRWPSARRPGRRAAPSTSLPATRAGRMRGAG